MAELIFLAIASSLVRIMPPRGPRRVLCGGRGGHVGVRDRDLDGAAGDETGEMGHVDQQVGADAVGDLAEPRSRSARNRRSRRR
jgi:hypothetical protein